MHLPNDCRERLKYIKTFFSKIIIWFFVHEIIHIQKTKHKTPSKRTGIGQAWFPKNWSDSKIKEAGKYVTNLPDNKNLPDGVIGYGEYDGVRVGIIKTDGKIGTIFPDADLQP